ncbi:hypothetical protein GCM10022402_31980 [Salinactinospora qingdaonensis]|uniref:Uncharacterized protein n=1 Tax=Salinactinospora qingdaonensis TaxID=702744 RepID=A0ABP7FWV3_9ACTN
MGPVGPLWRQGGQPWLTAIGVECSPLRVKDERSTPCLGERATGRRLGPALRGEQHPEAKSAAPTFATGVSPMGRVAARSCDAPGSPPVGRHGAVRLTHDFDGFAPPRVAIRGRRH